MKQTTHVDMAHQSRRQYDTVFFFFFPLDDLQRATGDNSVPIGVFTFDACQGQLADPFELNTRCYIEHGKSHLFVFDRVVGRSEPTSLHQHGARGGETLSTSWRLRGVC